MGEPLTVLDPTADGVAGHFSLAPRPAALDGLVLGVLDNGKPSSDRLLDLLVGQLRRSHDFADIVQARKANIGKLAEPAVFDDLAARCDVVLTGVGDCSGCCSCSAHDGVRFERAGRPAAVVCTAEFLGTARVSAEAAGLPGYGFAVIDHPLGSATTAELERRAYQAAWQVEALLLTGEACAC